MVARLGALKLERPGVHRVRTRIVVFFTVLLVLVQGGAFLLVNAADSDNARSTIDQELATASPYGAPVAPPTFIIGCFSGIQFGWPGLGSFHSESTLTFHRPVYWGDVVSPTCEYTGFDGPSPSSSKSCGLASRMCWRAISAQASRSAALIRAPGW